MGFTRKAADFARALVTRTLDFEFERMDHRIENVSMKKLLTVFRSETNLMRRRLRSPWYPSQLQIEVSSSCTLRCPLCPSGRHAMAKERRNMQFDTFRSLMDEVGDHAVVAILWMWGEPFMNPKFCDMIAYAKSKNVATLTSTNGQCIQTREEAEQLVASGLDNLIVALDGATQETYSRYRVGGDVQKVFRCLELIRQAKESLGSEKPGVNVRTVVTKHNEHELPEIERIARQYGADMVSKKRVWIPDCAATDDAFAPNASQHQPYEYRDGRRVRLALSEFRCRRPWNRLHVNWDGTVLSCEFDYDAAAPFGPGGNGNSFMQAWWGKPATEFRERFLRDRSVYPCHPNCGYQDTRDSNCTTELSRLRS